MDLIACDVIDITPKTIKVKILKSNCKKEILEFPNTDIGKELAGDYFIIAGYSYKQIIKKLKIQEK